MSWPTARIGSLARPKQWPILSRAEMSPSGFPLFSANGQIGFASTYTHERPTLLVGCRGSCGTLHITPPRAYANGNAMALDSLDESRLDVRFLYRFLERRGFEDVVSGSSQPQITRESIARIQVPLPHLEEQRRIAAILDQADVLRRTRIRALAKLSLLSASLLTDLFGDPISNPRDHRLAELYSLIDEARPITYGILKPGPDEHGGIPYVRVLDMRGGKIAVDQVRRTSTKIAGQYKRSMLKDGDLLISIRGHVGRMAFTPAGLEGANITQDTARLAITNANPSFVRAVMEHPSSKRWLAARTRGIAVQGINLGDLRRFPVIMPPRDDQDRFARSLEEVDHLRATGEEALSSGDALFRSLQHRAFRGELSRTAARDLDAA